MADFEFTLGFERPFSLTLTLNELTFENYIHTEHNHTVGRCADYTVRSAVRECGGIVKVTATRLARDETGRTPRRETTERRKSPKIAP